MVKIMFTMVVEEPWDMSILDVIVIVRMRWEFVVAGCVIWMISPIVEGFDK